MTWTERGAWLAFWIAVGLSSVASWTLDLRPALLAATATAVACVLGFRSLTHSAGDATRRPRPRRE